MAEPADVVVIGMGPGGEDVAGRLAEAGLDVVGVESGLVGGECPYWGCVPSKMIIRAANALAEARRVPGLAGSSSVDPDWGSVAARIRQEATDGWDDRVAVERFEKKGGRFVRGRGRLAGAGAVTVGDHRFVARTAVVVATGAENRPPPITGLSDTPYWTNRDVMEASELPSSLLILGGGAIGLEIGQALARFGVAVTVVEAADRLLPTEDPEAGTILESTLAHDGITVFTAARATAVAHGDGRFRLTTAKDELYADQLLVATGRRPDLHTLGLDTMGVETKAPFLATDEQMRVAPGLWAVGDVTGVGAFTHVAMYQSRIAAAAILGHPVEGADYRAVPRVTFTDPEIGSVGLSEAAAQSTGLRVRVGRSTGSARGWIHRAGDAEFIKILEDADRGVLVGALSIGPSGGEVLGLLTLAVHAAIPVALLRQMIYAYPTFHRGVESALADLH
jgi:pyruvate/2-oxoglutarate dehydrogenase complex dihydrolipoamide dehydrogenase (E3) component